MKSAGQEGWYTKIATVVAVGTFVVGVVGLVLMYRAWKHPVAPPTDDKTPNPVLAATTPSIEAGEIESSQPSDPPKPSIESSDQPCDSPETAVLTPGTPSKIANGLATLSITPGRMGAEKFLTLGIASDREARPETVLGASGPPYRFKTSGGTYFVNVTQIDFEANTMTVQVGCEPKGASR